jgi:4-carboxymuconolactone decarboxylase
MSDMYQKAKEVIDKMQSPESAAAMLGPPNKDIFAGEFAKLALDNVYAPLWTRPGLSLRDRSLLTLGILIALRIGPELKSHFAAAMRNGLTREQLEEVIYHATGYAGFPAAAAARAVAAELFEEKKA